MIYKHFTQYKTKKWNDVLPLFLLNYNSAKHSSTGYTPLALQQAFLDGNEELLAKAKQKLQIRAVKMLTPMQSKPELQIGDHVRIAATTMSNERKLTFRKNYLANWSKAIYTVASISLGSAWQHPQYKLANEHGHTMKQRFYRSDLQATDPETLAVNRAERPDYSKNGIFNQEAHAQRMAREGQMVTIILPPSTQGQDRLPGARKSKAPMRLIDQLIQEQEHLQKQKKRRKEGKDKDEV